MLTFKQKLITAQSSKWGSFFSHLWEDFSKIRLFSSSLRQHVLDVVLPRAQSTSFVSFWMLRATFWCIL